VQAICTEIEEQLYKNLGRSPEHARADALPNGPCSTSAVRRARFGEQARRIYDLERLWRFGAKLDIPTMPKLDPPIEPCRMHLSSRSRSTMRRLRGTLGGRSQR